MSSSSRKRLRPSVIYKMQQTVLFQRTLKHHELCLKEMFRENYQSTSSGDENREWASNLSDTTMEKFRVHLSWVMGCNVFDWSKENIGQQILESLKGHHVDYDYILC